MEALEALQPNAPLPTHAPHHRWTRISLRHADLLVFSFNGFIRRRNQHSLFQLTKKQQQKNTTCAFTDSFYSVDWHLVWGVTRKSPMHSSARRSRSVQLWWRLLVVRRVLDGPTLLWWPSCFPDTEISSYCSKTAVKTQICGGICVYGI